MLDLIQLLDAKRAAANARYIHISVTTRVTKTSATMDKIGNFSIFGFSDKDEGEKGGSIVK